MLTAIKIIEDAVLKSSYPADPAIDKIISDELKRVQLTVVDTTVLELLFSIKYNWEVYSGQKESRGLRSGTNLLKHWILDDCNELRTYIQKYL